MRNVSPSIAMYLADSVLVLFFEEFVSDIAGHIDRTLSFLGLDSAALVEHDLEAQNVFALPRSAISRRILGSGMARDVARLVLPRSIRARGRDLLVAPAQKPPLDPDVRRRLRDVYRSDVDDLSQLLCRRPPWPEFELPAD